MSFEEWAVPYLKAWDRRWQMRKGLRDAYQAGKAAQREIDAQIAERDLILMGNKIATLIRNQDEVK